jgi:hypothetical protein
MNPTAEPTSHVAPETLMAFLNKELPAAEFVAVEQHLQDCVECQVRLGAEKQLTETLNSWAAPSLCTDAESRILAVIKQGSRNSNWAVKWPKKRWLIAAPSAVALMALIAFSFWNEAKHTGTQALATRPYNGAVAPIPPAAPVGMVQRGNNVASFVNNQALIQRQILERQQAAISENLDFSTDGDNVPAAVPQPQPMIARSVSLVIVAKQFNESRTALDRILTKHHGYAAELSVGTEQNAPRSLQASLRIPADELASSLAEMKGLGQLLSETQAGEEVTQQHADLVARLKNSRQTEQRLQAILQQRTGKISDVLDVEREIARVRGEIEQMESDQKALEHRVDFTSIDLKLSEEYRAALGTPSPSVVVRLRNAAIQGFREAFETLLALALFAIQVVPSVLLWAALLILPTRLVWKRRREWLFARGGTPSRIV